MTGSGLTTVGPRSSTGSTGPGLLVVGALLLGVVLALGLPSAPPAPPPVSKPAPIQVTLERNKPRRVPGPTELATRFPGFGALSSEGGMRAALAMADVTAPCEPCQRPPRPLAECAMDPPEGCENLPGLIERVLRQAEDEPDPEKLRLLVAYGDVWIPGVAPVEPTGPVLIDLWVELQSPLLAEALDRLDQLRCPGGERCDRQVEARLHLIEDPQAEPPGQRLYRLGVAAQRGGELEPLLRCLVAARALRSGPAFAWANAGALEPSAAQALAELPACASLDPLALEQRAAAVEVDPKRVRTTEARSLGVRTSPTWFINGYRMRGLQSQAALEFALQRELSDRAAEESN